MKTNGFFIVPYMELEGLPLTRVQFYVYAYIYSYARKDGECSASVSQISKAIRWEERIVTATLGELIKAGYLEREFANGKTPIYKLRPLQNLHPCKKCTPAKIAPVPLQNLHPSPAKIAPHKDIIRNNKNNIPGTPAPTREGGYIKENLREVFELWLEHKKQKGKPLTTESERRACYELLEKYSGGDTVRAIDIVNRSIANGWASLVELPKQAPAPTDEAAAFRVHLQELERAQKKQQAADDEYEAAYAQPGASEARDTSINNIAKIIGYKA